MATALKNSQTDDYTYSDYMQMPDDGNRWEIVHGVPYMMAAPSTKHQRASSKLSRRLGTFLEGRRCEVFTSPFDVRLPLYNEKDEDVTNIVQPDIVVYCNPSGFDEKGGKGAPDLVVEILSPSSAIMDRFRKFRLYELAGVKEYWIVDAESESVEVYVHDGVKFSPKMHFGKGDRAASAVMEGFSVDVMDVFESPFEA